MNVGIYLLNAPAEVGGGFTFEQEVLEGILEHEATHRHQFTAFSHAPELRCRSASDVRHVSLSADSRSSRLSWFKKIRSRAVPQELNTDALVADSGIDILLNLAPWKTLAWDIPYISFVWDLMHRSHPYFPEVSHGRVWEGRERDFATVLRRAAIVITGTQVGQEEIERFYGLSRDRIRLLPHPTPRFALASPSPGIRVTNVRVPKEYILYPAGFWPHKNHANLLLALVNLREKHGLRVPLVFVGSDQGNRSFIEEKIRTHGLQSQVHILGFLPREDLVALYRNALSLCYTSFSGPENFPPLEAFGLGCPVIASRIPGAQEQLGDAALLVDPSNPDEIAEGILTFLRNPELRLQYVERGRKRADRFTTRDFVKNLFGIFDELEPIRRAWGKNARFK